MKLQYKYLFHRIIGHITSVGKKGKLLERYGWYRNMHGGWTHPHGMDFLYFWEIWKLNLEQLEYKLQHGSRAVLPDQPSKQEHPVYSFKFRCDNCHETGIIHEEYSETKEYACPKCGIVSVIPRKNVMYRARRHPYTFECPYCYKIQRIYNEDYKGEIDGYYVTECDCPDCGKHIVHEMETAAHYFCGIK